MLIDHLGRLFGVRLLGLSNWKLVLFVISIFLLTLNIFRSASDCRLYGGVDLRARIVGARALIRGVDPYTLSYSARLPSDLQDPLAYHSGLSRCGAPPSLLLFFVPLTFLEYNVAHILWTILQWIALIVMIAFLSRTLNIEDHRGTFIILAFCFFGGACFWRLHVERGTYYVFTAMVLSWGILRLSQDSRDRWLAGVPFGLFVVLRPTGLVLIPCLFIFGFRKTALASFFLGLTLFAGSLTIGGTDPWKGFFYFVRESERDVLDDTYLERNHPILNYPLSTSDGYSISMLPMQSANVSVLSLLQESVDTWRSRDGLNERFKAAFPLAVKGFFLTCFLVIWGAFLILHERGRLKVDYRLFLMAFSAVLADYAAPIRYGYADVHLCVLTGLMVPWLVTRSPWYLRALFLLSLASEFWLFSSEKLATGVRSAGVMSIAFIFLFDIWRSQRQQMAKRRL